MTFFLSQMQIIDSNNVERLNTLSDATALMTLMEDERVRVAALANFCKRNLSEVQATILETRADDYLEFSLLTEGAPTSRYTLRQFIGNETYSELVERIVELNGWENFENPHINIILLDKINRHADVLDYFVHVQLQHIEKSKPREFLTANLNTEGLQQVLNKQLVSRYPEGVKLATREMNRLISNYRQQGHTAAYPELFGYLLNLELISEVFNEVIHGEVIRAQDSIERFKELPVLMDDQDNANKFYKQFEAADLDLKWLLLDVVVASVKCMYIHSMQIVKRYSDGRLNFEKSAEAEKNRRLLKQRQVQVQNMAAYVDSLLQNKSYAVGNKLQASSMQERCQQITALIRKILTEIRMPV